MGVGVVIARYFGAREYEKLKKAIHTALAFGGVCGIFLTVAALILVPQILKLIGTPEEVLPKSLVYQFGDILILFLKTDWIHGLEKQGQGA